MVTDKAKEQTALHVRIILFLYLRFRASFKAQSLVYHILSPVMHFH